ncbi:MAG: PAS domain-containing protein [Anaeromyxobacter sp.]
MNSPDGLQEILAALQSERERADAALARERELQDRLDRVTSSVPGVICAFKLSPDGRASMPFVSPAGEELYGVPPAALVEDFAPVQEKIHPDDVGQVLAGITDAWRSHSRWHATFRYRHPVKGLRWLEGWSIPSAEPDGSVVWFGYVTDVTDRARADSEALKAAQVMREWLEGIPAVAWRTDPQGNIVERNRRWLEYTGQLQATGPLEWLHLVHPDDRERVKEAIQAAVAAGGPFEAEFRLRRADGAYRWILGRASAVPDASGALVWLGIGTDLQDRKQMEQVLRQADQRKNEFLALLGHELRNPLAPIASSLFILQHTDPAGAQGRRALEIISHQVEHLTRLVDDLLDVSRIERGRIELRRTRLNLNEVVRRSAEDRRQGLEEQGISLVVDTPARPTWVDGDVTRLAQIVGNLLHNAAKFTEGGGRVTISVREGPDGAELSVRDTGAGIDPGLLEQVFEPFTQGAQGLARTTGGLGLGLALVKGLAEQHGGSAIALSEGPGRGVEVLVRLPPAPPSSTAPRPPAMAQPPPPVPPRRLHVLVVEDTPETAQSLAQVLEILGYEAEIAPDGPAALQKARAHAPDVVLCDIGLPGMSGYEVARALRGGEAPGATLVAISGYALPEDRRAAAEAGFDQHLAKPARLEELERLLATVATAPPGVRPLAASPGR